VGNFSGTVNVGTTKPFIGSALQLQLGLLSSWITIPVPRSRRRCAH
jgi:hypothetical protein